MKRSTEYRAPNFDNSRSSSTSPSLTSNEKVDAWIQQNKMNNKPHNVSGNLPTQNAQRTLAEVPLSSTTIVMSHKQFHTTVPQS